MNKVTKINKNKLTKLIKESKIQGMVLPEYLDMLKGRHENSMFKRLHKRYGVEECGEPEHFVGAHYLQHLAYVGKRRNKVSGTVSMKTIYTKDALVEDGIVQGSLIQDNIIEMNIDVEEVNNG